ncbi:MAG: hypothetical protein V3V08_21210 [Nannocystaceae bacterium]
MLQTALTTAFTLRVQMFAPSVWLLLLPIVSATAACNMLEESGGGHVTFYAAHHGTPREGQFPPDLSPHPDWREFDTDDGWHIKLAEGYVSVGNIALRNCDHGKDLVWMEFQHGESAAEDIVGVDDTRAAPLGSIYVPAGSYCALLLDYGHYSFPDAADEVPPAARPDNASMEGMTVLLHGHATRGEETEFFRWQDRLKLDTLELSLTTLENGGALYIGPREGVTRRITIAKPYDRFLDGVDFSDFDRGDLEDTVRRVLEKKTWVMLGNTLGQTNGPSDP